MDFINSIIHNSSGNFISGRTIIPGPAPQIRRGLVIRTSTNTSSANTSANIVGKYAPPNNFNRVIDDDGGNSVSSDSILRTSVIHMNSSVPDLQDHSRSIPKAYNDLDKNACAKVVSESIRNIIMYTTNDDFREKCFTKLGVSSSAEAEIAIRAKLEALIAQQEILQQQNETNREELEANAMLCEEYE